MSDLRSISLQDIRGQSRSLAEFHGQVVLIVNVASRCGLTPQYEGLEALFRKYQNKGLVVLGFPANDFLAQEPGSEAEIAQFCKSTYDVSFPMFKKLSVKGPQQHPLYRELTKSAPHAYKPGGLGGHLKSLTFRVLGGLGSSPEDVSWNFEKFLIDRSGQVIGRFAPTIEPLDPALTAAVEKALAMNWQPTV